jgi:uncharacterized Zn-binding protein involved in type VI secretion
MKNFLLLAVFVVSLFLVACDVQSGIASKSVEKYVPTPTPEKSVEVVEKIDTADIDTVDTATQGDQISINPSDSKANVDCKKYNRVIINGDAKTFVIKGACQQILVNGDRNKITTVAFSEIVLNGYDNIVEYSKYVNGKQPVITDNGKTNTISKAVSTEPKPKK